MDTCTKTSPPGVEGPLGMYWFIIYIQQALWIDLATFNVVRELSDISFIYIFSFLAKLYTSIEEKELKMLQCWLNYLDGRIVFENTLTYVYTTQVCVYTYVFTGMHHAILLVLYILYI